MLKKLVQTIFFLYSINLYADAGLLTAGFTATNNLLPPPTAANNTFEFVPPDILLIDQHDQNVSLQQLFSDQQNLVFAFFFTQCVSVCTTTTLSLKSIQPHLPAGTLVAMISIDPDTDTAESLKQYAKKHHITEKNWYLLTGENDQIIRLQKSFEAYRGNKMNHNTSLFFKKSGSNQITEVKTNFANIPQLLK